MSASTHIEQSNKVLPAESILRFLSDSQYLDPHQPLKKVLRDAVDSTGVCPDAVAQSLRQLQLDAVLSIGRFRRSDLVQLSQGIYQSWRQAVTQGLSASSAG